MSDKVPIEDQKSEIERIIGEHGPLWKQRQGMDDREYESRMRRLRGVRDTLNWIERNRAKLKDIK